MFVLFVFFFFFPSSSFLLLLSILLLFSSLADLAPGRRRHTSVGVWRPSAIALPRDPWPLRDAGLCVDVRFHAGAGRAARPTAAAGGREILEGNDGGPNFSNLAGGFSDSVDGPFFSFRRAEPSGLRPASFICTLGTHVHLPVCSKEKSADDGRFLFSLLWVGQWVVRHSAHPLTFVTFVLRKPPPTNDVCYRLEER